VKRKDKGMGGVHTGQLRRTEKVHVVIGIKGGLLR